MCLSRSSRSQDTETYDHDRLCASLGLQRHAGDARTLIVGGRSAQLYEDRPGVLLLQIFLDSQLTLTVSHSGPGLTEAQLIEVATGITLVKPSDR
jgi:hypothetical protein